MPTRSSVSRRDFMKGAAAVTAAATFGFPTIIPSSALGGGGQVAPSNRLTIGMIGLGKQGAGSHLNGLIGRTDMQVLAIADVYTKRREFARNRVDSEYARLERKAAKACTGYVDYHELLARSDIDTVLIATPDHWHTAIVLEACKAKKDIYCEKPLTLTIAEAKSMIDAVRKYDRVFQTGSQQRSSGPFREVAEYVRNGKLGKIRSVQVALAGKTSKPYDLAAETIPEGLEWDVWLGQAPKVNYNKIICNPGLQNEYPFNPGWRDYREFSGGYVTDWGAHHLDITQWALGMDRSGPVEILPPEKAGDVYGAKLIYRGSAVGDEITVTQVQNIELPEVPQPPAAAGGGAGAAGGGGAGGRRAGGGGGRGGVVQRLQNNGILFTGENGQIFVNRERAIAFPGAKPFKDETPDENKVKLTKATNHHNNWLEAIKTRGQTICDVETGARSVTVCHLMNLAYWNGRKLKWDPQAWEFPGDAEANKWRTRDRRAPYSLPEV